MPQGEVGVEHNTIHAVIAARQKIPITFGELVNHRGTLMSSDHTTITPAANTAPSGAIPSERSLGGDVVP
jgi:hypothetical protein